MNLYELSRKTDQLLDTPSTATHFSSSFEKLLEFLAIAIELKGQPGWYLEVNKRLGSTLTEDEAESLEAPLSVLYGKMTGGAAPQSPGLSTSDIRDMAQLGSMVASNRDLTRAAITAGKGFGKLAGRIPAFQQLHGQFKGDLRNAGITEKDIDTFTQGISRSGPELGKLASSFTSALNKAAAASAAVPGAVAVPGAGAVPGAVAVPGAAAAGAAVGAAAGAAVGAAAAAATGAAAAKQKLAAGAAAAKQKLAAGKAAMGNLLSDTKPGPNEPPYYEWWALKFFKGLADKVQEMGPFNYTATDAADSDIPIGNAFANVLTLIPVVRAAETAEKATPAVPGGAPKVFQTIRGIVLPYRAAGMIIHTLLSISRFRGATSAYDIPFWRQIQSVISALLELMMGDWKSAALSLAGIYSQNAAYAGIVGQLMLSILSMMDPDYQESIVGGITAVPKSILIGLLLHAFQTFATNEVRKKAIETLASFETNIEKTLTENIEQSTFKAELVAAKQTGASELNFGRINLVQKMIHRKAMMCDKEFRNIFERNNVKDNVILLILFKLMDIPLTEEEYTSMCPTDKWATGMFAQNKKEIQPCRPVVAPTLEAAPATPVTNAGDPASAPAPATPVTNAGDPAAPVTPSTESASASASETPAASASESPSASETPAASASETPAAPAPESASASASETPSPEGAGATPVPEGAATAPEGAVESDVSTKDVPAAAGSDVSTKDVPEGAAESDVSTKGDPVSEATPPASKVTPAPGTAVGRPPPPTRLRTTSKKPVAQTYVAGLKGGLRRSRKKRPTSS